MNDVSDEFTKKELYEVAKLLEVKIIAKATKSIIVEAINNKIKSMNEGYFQPVVNPLGDNGLESASVDSVEVPTEVEIEEASESVFRGFHPITGEEV